MGLLDDAIREHLELKRLRGADPDEVARLEDEALGDPRSGEFARPDTVPAESAPADGASAEAPSEEDVPPEAGAYAAPPEPEPEAEPAQPEAPWLEDERIEPVASRSAAEPASPDAEPEAEVAPDDEPAADEDVLEETPDFLQETPEHDRLWFEQKPPRDFDFDR